METIKVGIIGCGYWGPNLVRNFVDLPTADVIAVADFNQERLTTMQKRHPSVATITDYRSLFTMGLDAVVIATPPASHYSIARECLLQGLHVLVEKPMTLSSRHAEDLIRIADLRGLTLMVGHTFEYNPAVRFLKELIQGGELGDIYYVNAIRANLGLFQPNLNVIWDLAPHDISILMYILGLEPTSVNVQASNHVLNGIHDVAFVHLGFPDGIAAHLHLSWLDPCKVRRITVVGKRKMAVYDDVEPMDKIKIYDKGVTAPQYTHTYQDFHISYRHGDVEIPHVPMKEPLRIECQHFIESIMNGTVPQSSGTVGLKVVSVVEAAAKSLMTGTTVKVAIPEGIRLDEHIAA